MRYLIDLGSTTIKIKGLDCEVNDYYDRKAESLKDSLFNLLESNSISPDSEFTISSSANGGIRTVLFSYTLSLTSTVAYDVISSSGSNVIYSSTKLDNNIDDIIESTDIVIIAGGTTLEADKYLLEWIESILNYLDNINFNKNSIILCINDDKNLFNKFKILKPLLDERLTPQTKELSSFIRECYLGDLSDKKNIKGISKLLNCRILPTPNVVHSGYVQSYLNKNNEFGSTQDSIWVDIGGATTDIYFPRLAIKNQDGINILLDSTSRFVLVSIGFNYSASNTLKTAKESFWYQSFLEYYNRNIESFRNPNLSEKDAKNSSEKQILICYCLLISCLNCCMEGELGFNYNIDFKRIKNIVLTGGGPLMLNKKMRLLLSNFLVERLATKIGIKYDESYTLWQLGHATAFN